MCFELTANCFLTYISHLILFYFSLIYSLFLDTLDLYALISRLFPLQIQTHYNVHHDIKIHLLNIYQMFETKVVTRNTEDER